MASAFFMLRFLQKRRNKKDNVNAEKTINREKIAANEVDKCRVCLKKASMPIFLGDGSFKDFDICRALSTFGGIKLSADDAYPKYICLSCHSILESAVLFRRTAQNTDKLLRQPSNNQNCDLSDDLDSNHEVQESLNSFTCKLCKLQFQSYEELIEHNNLKSHKNVRIQCPICHGILTAHLYKKHLARHQSATHLICDICGKLYRKDNLLRHLQLHSYELPFQCQVCPYRGRFMESLKIHMRTHSGDKPFSCDKCELHFLTRSNLNRHLLTHKKERPFKCVECGRGFHTKREMDTHFVADHVGQKDFNCRLCGNKYGTRKALMRHELRVHKRDKMSKGRVPLYMQAEYQNYSSKTV